MKAKVRNNSHPSRADAQLPVMIHNFSDGVEVNEALRGEWVQKVRALLKKEGPMSFAWCRTGRAIVIGVFNDEGEMQIFEVWNGYREIRYEAATGIAAKARRLASRSVKPGASSSKRSPKKKK
jgi:hypothetical protein